MASAVRPHLLYIGTKDGRLKVVDIDKNQAVKAMNVCNNALIELVVLEQQEGLPIVFGWPCKEKCVKIIDCETGRVINSSSKALLEFSCGVGPKASCNRDGSSLIVGSQGDDREIHFFGISKAS